MDTLMAPRELLSPAEVDAAQDAIALTDLKFTEQTVGWLRPMRDQVPVEAARGCFLEVGGEFSERGLYAHAPARHVVEVDKAWKRLTAGYGLQTGHPGSVLFVVRGDDRELFRSDTVSDTKLRKLDVDISQVTRLELIVENAGDGNGGDWGVWLDPRLTR